MKEIEVQRNKSRAVKILVLLAICLLLCIRSLYVYIMTSMEISYLYLNAMILFNLAIAWMTYRTLRIVFDKTPALRINSQGVYDFGSYFRQGLIIWDDIKNVKVITIRGHEYLVISLENTLKYINKLSELQKNFLIARMGDLEYPVALRIDMLKEDYLKVLEPIKQHLKTIKE